MAGDSGAKTEFGVDTFVEVQQSLQHWASLGKGLFDIGFRGGVHGGHLGAELEFHRAPAFLAAGRADDVFPREGGAGRWRWGAVDLDNGFGCDLEVGVGQVEEEPGDVVSEVVQAVAAAGGRRIGGDALGDHGLPGARSWA